MFSRGTKLVMFISKVQNATILFSNEKGGKKFVQK